jgi:hypothetical protein
MFHARAALRRAKELQFIGPSMTKIFVFKSPTGTTSDSGVFSLEAQ